VIEYPISLFLKKIWVNLSLMLLSLIAAISLGLLGANIIYQNIRKPLKLLTLGADQICNGDYSFYIASQGQNELARLGSAYNKMREQIRNSFVEIRMKLDYEKVVSEISSLYLHHDSEDFQSLLSRTCEVTGRFNKASEVLFYFKDPNTNKYTLTTHWTIDPLLETKIEAPVQWDTLDTPYLFTILKEHQIYTLGNQDTDKTIDQATSNEEKKAQSDNLVNVNYLRQTFLAGGFAYLVILPMVEQSYLFGFQMFLFSKDRLKLSESELIQFTTLSTLLSTSIIKTQRGRKLHDTSKKLSITLKSISDAVIAADENGIVTLINPITEKILECTAEEILNQPIEQVIRLVNPKTKIAIKTTLEQTLNPKNKHIYEQVHYLVTTKGNEVPIEASLSTLTDAENVPKGVVITFRDIGEKLKFENERVRMEKHEALGYLAAGMAHDFNNLLGTILGSISMARLTTDDDSETQNILSETEKVVMQGKDIATQLFALDKNAERIEGTSALLSSPQKLMGMVLYNSNVKVEYQLSENLPVVNMPEGTISQIVTNLLINAVHAMPNGGKLVVKTSLAEIDQNSIMPLKIGSYVQLNIVDNGSGIPPEELDKIFLPYYTTKETGSGLGIPTVFSLITKHSGYFRISSEVGVGTDAELYFPIV